MKNLTIILAFVGMMTLQSCSNDNNSQPIVDNDTISEVFEYSNVNFTTGNGFSQILTYPHQLYTSDMVLVYRLSGVFQGADVWKLQPETFYFDDGTLDFQYNFDFTRFDTNVYMNGFDLAGISTNYRLGQVFRVVVIPAYFGNKQSSTIKVDFNDYNAVIKAYHIDESKVIKVQ
ncbi:hypothetical protein EZL74_04815 [Flavobacterium silvisoli]|uniref:Lipoprotein n=1 Tax=Flavobacterium silvisoli TaxID=2529433 RepID=A0A4Q9Z1E8_9FLAO|nr:hypothetical protein [Flavobacterium silvisoli]TBX70070.1 hypothetical protein EZL74_04815 [Flavobacterium silvisoli]